MKLFKKKEAKEEKIATGRKEHFFEEVQFKTTLIQWDKIAEDSKKENINLINSKKIEQKEKMARIARKEIFDKMNQEINTNEINSYDKRIIFKNKINNDKKNELKRRKIQDEKDNLR